MGKDRSKIAKRAVKRGKKWELEVAKDFEGRRKWWKSEDVETEGGLYIECKERQSISPWLERAVSESIAYGFQGIYVVGFFVALDYYLFRDLLLGRAERPLAWLLMAVTRAGPKYIDKFLDQAKRQAKPGDPGLVALKRLRKSGEYKAFRVMLMRWDDFCNYFANELWEEGAKDDLQKP